MERECTLKYNEFTSHWSQKVLAGTPAHLVLLSPFFSIEQMILSRHFANFLDFTSLWIKSINGKLFPSILFAISIHSRVQRFQMDLKANAVEFMFCWQYVVPNDLWQTHVYCSAALNEEVLLCHITLPQKVGLFYWQKPQDEDVIWLEHVFCIHTLTKVNGCLGVIGWDRKGWDLCTL